MDGKNQEQELIQAIKNGKSSAVERFLQNDCNPNCCVNDVMCTPALILAVTEKRYVCLKLLINYGAAVDACDKLGMTAAMYASDRGLTDYLNILVESGADINRVNHEGATLLMLATKWGKFDCVQYLIDNKVDIDMRDNKGKTALMYAAIHGSIECLHLLISAKADLNIADSEKGFTALLFALEHCKIECANILLQHKAAINIKVTKSETTVLTIAFRNSREVGEFSIIEELLFRGADLTLSQNDQNCLHEMVTRGKKKIVRLMVINGCPPHDRICWEHFFRFSEYKIPISPLCVALLSGFYDIAKYFAINCFFTNYDITILSKDPDIHQQLQDKGENGKEALAILNLISSSPQSLKSLSSITISDIISKVTATNKRRYTIVNTGLPKQLQSELLFDGWTSQICLLSWPELALNENQVFEPCNSCNECFGKCFRLRKNI